MRPLKTLMHMVRMLTTGVKKRQPWYAGIDITNRCNLRCKHCYWWRQKHTPELADEQMINFMKDLYNKGFKHANILGGEPALRPKICKEASKIFDLTWVFTNGTLGYPNIRPGIWALSIEGTREIHNKIRGKGVYEKAIGNIGSASDLISVYLTITNLNKNLIGKMLSELSKREIYSVIPCFYCPSKSDSVWNRRLTILPKERDKLVDELLKYKKEYGDFLIFAERTGYYYKTHGGFSKWNSTNKCPTKVATACFSPNGVEKYSCPYGAETDCSKCGCIQVAMLMAMRDFDRETIRTASYWAQWLRNFN